MIFLKKIWLHVCIAIVFLLYSSIRRASFFFISSIILSFQFWNTIFAGISKPPCSISKEYLFEPVISHLIFPACLTKKCASFDTNFGRWPTATNSLLINAIAYLSWTNDCGSSSCLDDKIEPIGASQNDLKIWYPQTWHFTAKTNSFSRKIYISSSNKYFSCHCVNAIIVYFIKPCLNAKLCSQYQIN